MTGPLQYYFNCLEEFVPARKTVKSTVSSAPQRRDFTVNEVLESAFMKLARIEASELGGDDVDAGTIEQPPVPVGGAKRRRRFSKNRTHQSKHRSCRGSCCTQKCHSLRISEEQQEAEILEILKGTDDSLKNNEK